MLAPSMTSTTSNLVLVRATLVAFALAIGAAGSVPAARAATSGRGSQSPAQQIAHAYGSVNGLTSGLFAHGRRSSVLRLAYTADRLGRRRNACATLKATDDFITALSIPTTWVKQRVPRLQIRKPLSLLNLATRALLRKAGRRCAIPVAVHPLPPRKGGAGGVKVPVPVNPSDQGDGLIPPLPAGPYRPTKSIGPSSGLGGDLHGDSALGAGANPLAFAASDPLTFFRNSDVGVPGCCDSPQEPNVAIGGHVVWYTGNADVGFSTNDGRTFTMLDPSTILPDNGLGFCCDQLVSYSPSYNMFVWVMQYWCNPSSCLRVDNSVSPPRNVCRSDGAYNRIRIAVARPEDLIANASNPGVAWTYWDVTPHLIGQPANAWFDRSDMSVNPWNMNWNVDILCGSAGSLQGRISLSDLNNRGTVTLSYITPGGRMTSVQGLGTTTTYFAGNTSDSQSRIWSWAPFSGTLFPHDVSHSSVPTYDNSITGSDSGNWYDRYGIFPGEVESSTLSGNTLYLAQGTGRAYCTANCDKNYRTLQHVFDQDAILITKYDVNTWNEVGERWLWNPTLALAYPALQTDGVGDVGIAFRASNANHNPQPVAGFLTPDEQFTFAEPEGMPHEAGDYYSLRPGRTAETFVMTGQTVQNDAGTTNMHWNYIEYGHGTAPYVSPPSVAITQPANLANFQQGTTVTYSANVSDPVDGTLPAAAIRWTEDGSPIGTGESVSHAESVIGTHVIVVTATNGDGKSASAQVAIHVTAPPGPGTPMVSIVRPANDVVVDSTGGYADVSFTATASDPNGQPLTYSWTDSVNGGTPTQVSTSLSPTLRLYNTTASCVNTPHDLTLTASNGTNTGAAFVRVYIRWQNNCIQ